MSVVTLELVQAKQAELSELISKLMQPAPNETISLPAVNIELQPRERYAGAVLDEQGHVKHHLILLPATPDEDLNWEAAKAWAAGAGGDLPDRQEQALLFANCKAALPQRWCWSKEPEGASYAWLCYFLNGNQLYGSRSAEGCAVAVRRFIPSTL